MNTGTIVTIFLAMAAGMGAQEVRHAPSSALNRIDQREMERTINEYKWKLRKETDPQDRGWLNGQLAAYCEELRREYPESRACDEDTY